MGPIQRTHIAKPKTSSFVPEENQIWEMDARNSIPISITPVVFNEGLHVHLLHIICRFILNMLIATLLER
jgi:hypothetical protein